MKRCDEEWATSCVLGMSTGWECQLARFEFTPHSKERGILGKSICPFEILSCVLNNPRAQVLSSDNRWCDGKEYHSEQASEHTIHPYGEPAYHVPPKQSIHAAQWLFRHSRRLKQQLTVWFPRDE